MSIRNLRVVFCGASFPFTAPPLRAVAKRCKLVGVIESAPSGKTAATMYRPTPLEGFARRRKLPYLLMFRGSERPREFIRACKPDVMCVTGFTHILRRDEFDIPKLGTINMHPSLLPKFRGPMPYFWQAHETDLRGGVTVHFIDAGIDTGDIITQREYPIRLGATHAQQFPKLSKASAEAMIGALEKLASGTVDVKSQRDLPCPMYARKVEPGEFAIDWNRPIQRVWHFLRATHPGFQSLPKPADGGRWRIGLIDRTPSEISPGSISQDDRGYFIAHRDGKIRLERVAETGKGNRIISRILGTAWHYKTWW